MSFLFQTISTEGIRRIFLLHFSCCVAHMPWVYYVHSRVQMPETASWGPRLGNFPEIQNSGRELPCFDPIHRSSGTRPLRRRIIGRAQASQLSSAWKGPDAARLSNAPAADESRNAGCGRKGTTDDHSEPTEGGSLSRNDKLVISNAPCYQSPEASRSRWCPLYPVPCPGRYKAAREMRRGRSDGDARPGPWGKPATDSRDSTGIR